MSTQQEQQATRVVVSYPTDLSKWGRDTVEGSPFRSYLTKVHETANEGDRWEEFVGVGCCGSTLDVPLVVEGVEGGERLTEDTEIVYEVRDSCEIEGGWRVQSADGPTE
ncbi:hypothetical protein VB773_03055 [Haloarculaceae archaeon H-GB2-1]|nr:hypothetical protein [Haloarculaceae archaeon H-GB1-1]MEA5388605.1 hypothetical protein [Haloarculaceae archaeon H-GB11]MEA5406659.1 hypothetical protein [Haloarculaceae archaeon H-GB2-1]